MSKVLTLIEARNLINEFLSAWDQHKDKVDVSGKALYELIGVKKAMENVGQDIQETVSLLIVNNGGTPNDKGGFDIPDEKQEEINDKLADVSNTSVEIDAPTVHLKSTDKLPVEIMDATFDFIEMAE